VPRTTGKFEMKFYIFICKSEKFFFTTPLLCSVE
jgi:hypothetical protein